MAKFGIGQAVRRVEDQRFTVGSGQFVDDLTLARQCYGVALLSPHAHAGGAARRLHQYGADFGANPAACIEIMQLNSQIDVSAVLPTIHVPTLVIHRKDDVAVNVEGGRELAALIPNARYVELPGIDHIPFVGDNAGEISDAVEEFLTGSRAPVSVDRVLATVLFTDIVGSTEKAAALGDRR
jgi:pimeloyl-ACP methyl ester carboxylesterase